MGSLFTSAKALEYSRENKIEEWVHEFLEDEGNNVPFSEGLKLEKRFFIGPIKMPLQFFERCCGPEENIKYPVNEEGFNHRVTAIAERFNSGWDMPPLIINYCEGKFELNDGNHRYEALVRSGVKEYYIIIWITNSKDYERFNEEYYSA